MPDAPVPLDFGLGSDPGRDGADAGPMHWNCHVEPVKEGKHPAPLRAMDGLVPFAATGSNAAIRGVLEMAGALYVVSGTQLFKIDANGSPSVIGGIAGTSRVILAKNAASPPELVLIVDGSPFSCISDVLAAFTDSDLPSPNSAAFLNQRIYYGINDGRVFFSDIDDATSISALSFFTAEGDPDGCVRVFAHMGELWVFGTKTLEVFAETGDETNPLRRNTAGPIPKGCLGRDTVAALDMDLFWVGNDGVVYRARGYTPEAISTFGVNEAIRTTTDKSAIEAMTYNYAGHSFYVLSGPDWTWAFNRSTGLWDPRFSYGLERWRASLVEEFNGRLIVGDYSTDRLYQISRDAHDEAGTKMVWRARTAPMHAFPNQISVDRLHLDFLVGVGRNSSDPHEADPQVGMRFSDDGGHSWSNQLFRSLGRIGNRKTRITYDGLGTTSAMGRIWELEASSPVVRSLLYSQIEGDPCST